MTLTETNKQSSIAAASLPEPLPVPIIAISCHFKNRDSTSFAREDSQHASGFVSVCYLTFTDQGSVLEKGGKGDGCSSWSVDWNARGKVFSGVVMHTGMASPGLPVEITC